MLTTIAAILASKQFQTGIIGVILLNAALLGVLTLHDLDPDIVHALEMLDGLCLLIFCIEILMKLMVYRLSFFRDGWNVFDFIVVAIALVPATGPLSVLRAMRVLRLLRLVTALPAMRRVIAGMFNSIPGVASVAGILLVIFYVSSIMAIGFFREADPEKFGSMGDTFFTLFQLMTTEGWPTITKNLMETMPYAWLFFIPFLLFTTFTTLNLVFGIIVSAMEQAKEEEARDDMAKQGMKVSEETNEVRLAVIENEVKSITGELAQLQVALERLLDKQSATTNPIQLTEK